MEYIIIATIVFIWYKIYTRTNRNKESLQPIFIHRHGYRLDFDDQERKLTRWRDSPRFKENPTDPPLLDANEPRIAEHAQYIPNDVQYIYTSPMTRCIQTSIILQRRINEQRTFIDGSHPIQIKVLYDLAEAGSIIDDKLMPDDIIRDYPSLICEYSPVDRVPVKTIMENGRLMYTLIGEIRARGEIPFIVAHCGHLYAGITHYCGFDPSLEAKISGNDKTGMLAICNEGQVTQKGGYRLIPA